MIVPYSKFGPPEAGLPPVYYAIVDVQVISPTKRVRLGAMIDSGAGFTLLNKDYATQLGLKWDSGIKSKIVGIDGIEHTVYVHDLELEVINLKNSRRKSKIAFVDLPAVHALLGQMGFFEHYVLRFKYYAKIFDVDVRS